EASNEELQSANEELLSGGEELQSLNEELQTSKEEIQTSNEELIVVNQELYDRNEQLNISRKYAESIVTTIREPLLILDEKLQVKSANKSFYKKFTISEDDSKGKSIFELGNRQWDIPAFRKALQNIIAEKASFEEMELLINLPGKGQRVMLLNASQILRDNNEESGILMAIEDITERKKVENEMRAFGTDMEKQVIAKTFSLNEAKMDLQQSNKNLEQLAFIASHDLQEPLRKIRTFSSMLNGEYRSRLPEPGQELLDKITSSSERMSALIKEVLNYSILLSADILYEKVDLNEIVENVIKDFDLLISEKNAVINCDQLPVIEAMPFQINQLFNNLIGNALKFSRAGAQPLITIACEKMKSSDLKKFPKLQQEFPFYSITIQDNGIGFDPKFSEQIFLLFSRLHGFGKFAGTGTGLALCKTIVANHQGEISAISTEGGGAVFKILLPVKQFKSLSI
ncbi:MAG: ATP-binding protein, partial [Chitinophagaceae bacterium]